jgi:hypothetical protein
VNRFCDEELTSINLDQFCTNIPLFKGRPCP